LTVLPSQAVLAFIRPDQFGDIESVAPDRNEVKDQGVLPGLSDLAGLGRETARGRCRDSAGPG